MVTDTLSSRLRIYGVRNKRKKRSEIIKERAEKIKNDQEEKRKKQIAGIARNKAKALAKSKIMTDRAIRNKLIKSRANGATQVIKKANRRKALASAPKKKIPRPPKRAIKKPSFQKGKDMNSILRRKGMEERIRKRDLRRQMAAKRAVLMRNQQAANDPLVRRRMAAKKKKASQRTVSIKDIELQTKMALRASQFKKSLEAKARLEKTERIKAEKATKLMKEEMRKKAINDGQNQKEEETLKNKKIEAERTKRISEVVKKREEQRKKMEEQIKKIKIAKIAKLNIKDKKLAEMSLDESKKEAGILSESKEEDIIAQNVEVKEELEVKQLVIAQLGEVDVSEENGRTVLKFSKDYELAYNKTRGLFGILLAISSYDLIKGIVIQNLSVSNKNGKMKDLKITLGSRNRSANLLKVQVEELDKKIEASSDVQHKGQLKLYINLFSTSWGSKENVIVIAKDSRIELIH